MKEEMIHDRLVIGIRDAEKLQLNDDLTLEKVKRCVRQSEAVREQQIVLQGTAKNNQITLDSVNAKHKFQTK